MFLRVGISRSRVAARPVKLSLACYPSAAQACNVGLTPTRKRPKAYGAAADGRASSDASIALDVAAKLKRYVYLPRRIWTEIKAQVNSAVDGWTSHEVMLCLTALQRHSSQDLRVRSLLKTFATRLEQTSDTLQAEDISKVLYSLNCMHSDALSVRKLLEVIATKLRLSSDYMSNRAISQSLYGFRMMSSDTLEVRRLLEEVLSKMGNRSTLTGRQVSRSLSGMQCMGSRTNCHADLLEVRSVLAAMLPSIAAAKMSSADVGDSLYGLQSLPGNVDEVRAILGALGKKMDDISGFRNRDVSRAIYGLKGMQADIEEVGQVLHALMGKIGSMTDVNKQALEVALYALDQIEYKTLPVVSTLRNTLTASLLDQTNSLPDRGVITTLGYVNVSDSDFESWLGVDSASTSDIVLSPMYHLKNSELSMAFPQVQTVRLLTLAGDVRGIEKHFQSRMEVYQACSTCTNEPQTPPSLLVQASRQQVQDEITASLQILYKEHYPYLLRNIFQLLRGRKISLQSLDYSIALQAYKYMGDRAFEVQQIINTLAQTPEIFDSSVANSALNTLCLLELPDMVRQLLDLIQGTHVKLHADIVARLAMRSVQLGRMDVVLSLIDLILSDRVIKLNVKSYGQVLASLKHLYKHKTHSDPIIDYVETLFRHMRSSGLAPSRHTYAEAMGLMLRAKRPELILELAKSMLKYQIALDKRHRSYICESLLAMSLPQEALKLLGNFPRETQLTDTCTQQGAMIFNFVHFDVMKGLVTAGLFKDVPGLIADMLDFTDRRVVRTAVTWLTRRLLGKYPLPVLSPSDQAELQLEDAEMSSVGPLLLLRLLAKVKDICTERNTANDVAVWVTAVALTEGLHTRRGQVMLGLKEMLLADLEKRSVIAPDPDEVKIMHKLRRVLRDPKRYHMHIRHIQLGSDHTS